MMRQLRLFVSIGLLAFIGLGVLWSPPPTTAQTADEIASCIYNYGAIACAHADDAGNWAKVQTHRKFYDTGIAPGVDGDMGNAYQHCAGAGFLATRVGYDTAVAITTDHEFYVPNAYQISEMDLYNNGIGARIGDDAKVANFEDMWGYVDSTCETLALNGSLMGPCGRGQYLTEEAYGSQDPGRILECPAPIG